MADAIKRLGKGSITTTETAVYTVPAVTSTVVRHITIANTVGVTVAFTLKLGTTIVAANVSLDPGEFLDFDTGQFMLTTETIQLQASASGLTYYITGVEIT